MEKQGISLLTPELPEKLSAVLKRAVNVLSEGGTVAYPTESFYGLAVDAANKAAIKKLFQVKGRAEEQPILILIPSLESVDQYADQIPPIARRLMATFWPGGLTLVFHAAAHVSPLLTAGTGKIGIRLSSHYVATTLARLLGAPITGTSANLSNAPSCRSAQEVLQQLGDTVDLILDGGITQGMTGSTVLDVTVTPPQVLREGMITQKQLLEYLDVP